MLVNVGVGVTVYVLLFFSTYAQAPSSTLLKIGVMLLSVFPL